MSVIKIKFTNCEEFFLIDKDMFEKVMLIQKGSETLHRRWWKLSTGYPATWLMGKNVTLHSFIMGEIPKGFNCVDHINRNRSDNRKVNLRFATNYQNNINSKTLNRTGFRGVYQKKKKFAAEIYVNKNRKMLGLFDSPTEAAKAYDKVAKELHGEFARLNFPNHCGLIGFI